MGMKLLELVELWVMKWVEGEGWTGVQAGPFSAGADPAAQGLGSLG